jgi:hypothetical protein
MAVTHPAAVRNSIADGVVDQLDLGSTNSTPRLVLNTSGDVEVATLNMSVTSFGAAAAGIATAAAIADDASATGGTTTKFRLTDRDNGIIIEGSVGTSGTDIVLSSNVIAATDTVSISSLTYTAPA